MSNKKIKIKKMNGEISVNVNVDAATFFEQAALKLREAEVNREAAFDLSKIKQENRFLRSEKYELMDRIDEYAKMVEEAKRILTDDSCLYDQVDELKELFGLTSRENSDSE